MRRKPGIYKRGNIYWITFTWKGRQHFRSSHSSDIRQAETLLEQTKNEIHKGWRPTRRADVPTLDQLLGSYIGQVESSSTQKRYRLSQEILRRHFGNLLITDIDAFMFDQLKESRRNEGVTAAGINRDMALARAAFNFAVKRRILPYSPLNGVKFLNETKNRNPPHAISYAEEEKILMCCDMRLRTIVTTLLESGMRVGIEALSLKWENVDLEEGTITVALSKTASGLRTLPMTSRLKSELEKWRNATASLSPYVFFNPLRPETHIRSVKKAWHRVLKLAGVPATPIYQCRHSFATRLAAAGISDTVIDQLLGHSRRDVLRFYTARVPEYLRDAIDALDKFRVSKAPKVVTVNLDFCEESSTAKTPSIN